MTDTHHSPDEAERLIAATLRALGVGPNAEEQPLPPLPTHRPTGYPPAAPDPDDWFVRLYGPDGTSPIEPAASPDADPDPDETDTELDEEPAARKVALPWQTKAGRKPTPRTGRADHPATADPRASLLDAINGVPPRLRRLAGHLAAAGLGWSFEWVDHTKTAVAWIKTEGFADVSSIFSIGFGVACLLLYRSSRGWWWPVAWFASVPAASVIAGVLLYAPNV